MAQVDEIRQLVSQSRSRVAKDRAMLQRLAQELSCTDQVIERATLAYNVSLGTLEKFERSQFNLRLSDQSSSASRLTAGAFGFFTFSQRGERPRR